MARHHSTILTKHDLFSYLGLVEAEIAEPDAESAFVTAVVKLDPREGTPFVKQFASRNEALRAYREAVATSVEREWRIVYCGSPLYG